MVFGTYVFRIHRVIRITLIPYEIVRSVAIWPVFLIPFTLFFILLIIIFIGVIIIVRHGCNFSSMDGLNAQVQGPCYGTIVMYLSG